MTRSVRNVAGAVFLFAVIATGAVDIEAAVYDCGVTFQFDQGGVCYNEGYCWWDSWESPQAEFEDAPSCVYLNYSEMTDWARDHISDTATVESVACYDYAPPTWGTHGYFEVWWWYYGSC